VASISLADLLTDFISQLISWTNTLWTHAIAFLDGISVTESYKKMANTQIVEKKGITILDLDEPNNNSPEHTGGSGISNYDLHNQR
jgi:hypothetical protein